MLQKKDIKFTFFSCITNFLCYFLLEDIQTHKDPPLSLTETALRWAGLVIILPVFFVANKIFFKDLVRFLKQ